ncbi:RnfABCDGE type electron transport complex subunit D [Anoxynatronum buryatiense]|uniref:Na+-transporting NADH:ubiquinone oxidoreductase subunit B n=1 Tax=Anoxynatronum buryatiense TaxID=489973 RepID=A0AA45WT40_9CLOT|nr:RnfABCDGE type electron transport complex subunit D [Anoxynatronum buryatiense]SMP40159.1 Na+-transporting NADH:ubiquinone oxidoreductase subunit B [Anoxynatronum buryatiense]
MVVQNKSSGFFQRQPIMRKVLISLIPVGLGAVYLFGLRLLALLAVVTAAGIATEYIFAKKRNAKVTEAVLVTSVLFTLSLPVATPFWVAVVGIVFGVLFAKEVFGGFGRNVFNPAIVGRTFIFISFPEFLTASWSQVFTGFPGGFVRYMASPLDTLTQATPLALARAGETLPFSQVIWGYTSGSMGETSVVLLLLGGTFLVLKKAADWKLMAAPMIGFMGFTSILKLAGVAGIPHPLYGMFTGAFFFLCIYFVTEPTTAPKTVPAKWVYGILIGMITVLIRYFGIFVEGASFAILIMNTFVPIMDEGVKYLKKQRKQVTS